MFAKKEEDEKRPETLGLKFRKTFVPIKNDKNFLLILEQKNETLRSIQCRETKGFAKGLEKVLLPKKDKTRSPPATS